MITYKLNGISEVVKALQDEGMIPVQQLDKVVKEASQPLVNRIKENYKSKGHYINGNLINSIEAFKRKRKGKTDPYFTYYVGPRYGVGGGNHAHFLEYGTLYSSYPVTGLGKTINGRKYGKFQTKQGYRIAPTGVIRKSKDEKEQAVINDLQQGVVNAILAQAKKKGFITK
jgi:hypothetical protein